mmetsp:Transcript_24303/g.56331  ORF Transcript_24303/g.56331 Transcript_24303/m.56331 type:complete len:256 (+) Transcript_24303:237-1004(+)
MLAWLMQRPNSEPSGSWQWLSELMGQRGALSNLRAPSVSSFALFGGVLFPTLVLRPVDALLQSPNLVGNLFSLFLTLTLTVSLLLLGEAECRLLQLLLSRSLGLEINRRGTGYCKPHSRACSGGKDGTLVLDLVLEVGTPRLRSRTTLGTSLCLLALQVRLQQGRVHLPHFLLLLSLSFLLFPFERNLVGQDLSNLGFVHHRTLFINLSIEDIPKAISQRTNLIRSTVFSSNRVELFNLLARSSLPFFVFCFPSL